MSERVQILPFCRVRRSTVVSSQGGVDGEKCQQYPANLCPNLTSLTLHTGHSQSLPSTYPYLASDTLTSHSDIFPSDT